MSEYSVSVPGSQVRAGRIVVNADSRSRRLDCGSDHSHGRYGTPRWRDEAKPTQVAGSTASAEAEPTIRDEAEPTQVAGTTASAEAEPTIRDEAEPTIRGGA